MTLAQELATLDHLSGGRLEVGLGAGHSFTEYAAMGRTFDPPAVRKARLGEAVEILRALLDGDPCLLPRGPLPRSTTRPPWRPCRSTSPSSSA